MSAAVRLQDATVVRSGKVVWSDGNLEVPTGALAGVIGPNGSGKTTMLQAILGLIPLARGEIEVLGGRPTRGDPRIGYVPQNYTAAVGDAMRCRDLVTLGISGPRYGLRRLSRPERARVEAALQGVGALDVADQRMSQLSGGQQQRVAIAQALVSDPALLLLDEPLANLDLRSQHEIVQLLAALGRERQVTILVVAHDLNPLLGALTGALYLLDGHPHYGALGAIVDTELLTHLYGTPIRVVRTVQGDLFTRSA